MSASRLIYTIGHLPFLTFTDFVKYLKKYGVNSVVDIRNTNNETYADFSNEKLRTLLKANGICYLSFVEEFGSFDPALRDSKGIPVYEKVKESELFLNGVKRLEAGERKGFTIVILGSNLNPTTCTRFTLIGRYLTECDWNVYHILEDGSAFSQSNIEDRLHIDINRHLEKNAKSAELGRYGETLAAEYLMLHGYRILDSNWNLHRGCELDIVAFKDNKIHAVEVKTRSDNSVIEPEQAITDKKLKNIINALNQYRYQKHLMRLEAQIDCIAIVFRSKDDFTLKMYENLYRRITWRY